MKIKKLLAQNSKLKKDGIFNFDIPAYKSKSGMITCPNAKACIANCYARQGTYMFPVVREKHEWNLEQSLKDNFVDVMVNEIKKRKCKIVRPQSAGDYYNREYAQKWLRIAELCPETQFYSYTKSWNMFDGMTMPKNFKLIQSFGGVLQVDKSKPHAMVYNDKSLIPNDYHDASESDLVAYNNVNIALVFHSTKKLVDNGFVNKGV
jgi:hypothetical protein